MEHSSPLAAMQPPSMLLGHCFRPDPPKSYPSCGSMSGLGGPGGPAGNFNFKDLSMKKSHSDYFNLKPVRGSSPTASLAADLSQNFHIDQRCVLFFVRLNPADKELTSKIALSWQRHAGLCSPLICSVLAVAVVSDLTLWRTLLML